MEKEKKPIYEQGESHLETETNSTDREFDYRHLFHLILDHSNDLIILLDKHNRILAINQRSAELLNGHPRDFEGQNISDVLQDDYREQRAQDLKKLFQTGEPIIYNRQVTFSGKKVWLETTIEPITDSNGDVQVALALSKDITEQKEVEKALSKTQAYYQGLFRNAQEAIFLIDDELNILDANPAACDISGYDRQELVSNVVPDYFSSRDSLSWHQILRLAEQTGSFHGVTQINKKDGGSIELDIYVVGNIQPGQHLLAGRDITNQKIIERALFESEERYRMLFDTASDAIFLMEGEMFISCNPATVQMYGCRDASEIINHTPWDFSPKFQPDGRASKEKGFDYFRL